MKKVLILAYDFPPYVSVGGLRPYSWYKYLHKYGVHPIVLTRQWNNEFGNGLDYIAPSASQETISEKSEQGEIIRTPYKPNLSNRLLLKYGENKFRLIRKTITAYYEFAQYLFKTGPKSGLYQEARKYLRTNQVDAIIATGDPFILFGYAASLGKEFDIPWIADYRDPWSQDKDFQRNALMRAWHPHFERKFVQSASAIVTVSDFLKLKIETLIKGKDFYIFTNGFDPEIIENGIEQRSDFLQLAFAGFIYDWNPLQSFLKVFSSFIACHQDAKIKVSFFGINKALELQEMLQNDYPNLQKHITVSPKIPNAVLLKELAESNALLLFNYYSFMGTKIFDYIGIRRKIILCYENDKDALELKRKYYTIEETPEMSQRLQAELIEETNSGIVVQDEKHLSQVLEELYNEFLTTGQIECASVGVENYSRTIQIEKLAEIIKSL